MAKASSTKKKKRAARKTTWEKVKGSSWTEGALAAIGGALLVGAGYGVAIFTLGKVTLPTT